MRKQWAHLLAIGTTIHIHQDRVLLGLLEVRREHQLSIETGLPRVRPGDCELLHCGEGQV